MDSKIIQQFLVDGLTISSGIALDLMGVVKSVFSRSIPRNLEANKTEQQHYKEMTTCNKPYKKTSVASVLQYTKITFKGVAQVCNKSEVGLA